MIPLRQIRLGNIVNVNEGLMLRMCVDRFFVDEQDRDCVELSTTTELMKRSCTCPSDLLEGVPLTEEIITDCGFAWDMVTATFQLDGFGVIDNGEQGYFALLTPLDYMLSIPLPDLHTLQNVFFYVTGKELPIKTAHFDIPEL